MPEVQSAIEIFPETDGVEILQKTMIFSRLDFEETQRIAAIMRLERFPRGKLIVEQDGLGQALFIVRAGEVAVYRRDSQGERDLLQRLRAGEIFGEMSLIEDLLVSADVEVSSLDAEVAVIPRREFEHLLNSNDVLALKVYKGFCRTLSERLRRLNAVYAELHEATDGDPD